MTLYVWEATLLSPQGDEERTRPVLTTAYDLNEVQAKVEALLTEDPSKHRRFVNVRYLGEAEAA